MHLKESVTNRPAPWEQAPPLPEGAPGVVIEARNRWFFNAGIYTPLEILLGAYPQEGVDSTHPLVETLIEASEHYVDYYWSDGDDCKGFVILAPPNSLQGMDALLFGILPGRCDQSDITFDWGNDPFGLPYLKALFAALGSYIREMYPKVGDTKYAREDGLDYRVLASLAGHGVDPTDDDRDPELAAQWAECRKDTLVRGAFAALQRIGESINNLFPEEAEEGEDT